MAIYLGQTSPFASCTLPGTSGGTGGPAAKNIAKHLLPRPLFALAPEGQSPCRRRYRRRGGLLPHRFTLTARTAEAGREAVCSLLPVPGVTPGGRYPLSCLVVAGLSSGIAPGSHLNRRVKKLVFELREPFARRRRCVGSDVAMVVSEHGGAVRNQPFRNANYHRPAVPVKKSLSNLVSPPYTSSK